MNSYEQNSSLGPCDVTRNVLSSRFFRKEKGKASMCVLKAKSSASDKDQAESALHFLEPAQ